MYSSSVWDPYSIPNINKLEKVQHFGLKQCSKNWTPNYPLDPEIYKEAFTMNINFNYEINLSHSVIIFQKAHIEDEAKKRNVISKKYCMDCAITLGSLLWASYFVNKYLASHLQNPIE